MNTEMLEKICIGDENATPHLRAAAEALADGTTLILPKGTYHLHEDGAAKTWLAPSNNRAGEKAVAFPLFGKRGVTIDGGGSTLVCHGQVFPFAALRCEDVTIRNLTITTRYPSCAVFTVEAKDDDGFTIRFNAGTCPYSVANGHIDFKLDGHVVSTHGGRLSLHALDRVAIVYLMAPGAPGDKDSFPAPFLGVEATDLGGGEVRFQYYGDSHPRSSKCPFAVGESVAVNLEEQRRRDVLFFEDCRTVTVEDVAIRRFGGMGVVAQRSGDISVRRLEVMPAEGEKVSTTADALQFINCFGKAMVEDCVFGWSMDDPVNIHGNYLVVEKAAGSTLRLRAGHGSHEGFFPCRPGDAVEFADAHSRAVLASARIVRMTPDPDDHSACTVEADAPVDAVPAGALMENVSLNPEVVVRNCRFSHYPNIRLSGRGPFLVEGNRMESGCSALLVMDLADYWRESGRVAEMVVRDNDFIDCNAMGGDAFVTIGVSGWGADAPKTHGRIAFENNRFSGVKGRRYSVSGVSEFSERRERPQFAFFGDSITDPAHIGCTANYWEFLADDMGITPLVYGVNGHQMKQLAEQAARFAADHPEGADALFVFAGTNDYNSDVPLGEWFTETTERTNHNGREVDRRRRAFIYDDTTFRGRINVLMRRLRSEWPATPVYLLTPLHRGFATFGPENVQPDESFANGLGLYIGDYVAAVKEAGNVWAATVIDINAESGLFPLFPGQSRFFHDADTDMLHPSAAGHRRIADAIERHLPFAPCTAPSATIRHR